MTVENNLDELVAESIALWCKRFTVKELAAIMNVQQRTVISWRSGNLPQMRHLIRMVDLWGEPFVDDCFGPIYGFKQNTITDRLLSAAHELQAIAKQLGKSPTMMIIFVAVFCSMAPGDQDVVRPPRPVTSRTTRRID